MKFKSSFIVYISLRLSSPSVPVLAAPVVHKTTTTSEQQDQSTSRGDDALKDVSASSVPGDVNHSVTGDQDVTVSNGSPRNLRAPSTPGVSVKGTVADVAVQRGGLEETDAVVHTSSDNTKLKDLGTVSSGGLISDVDNRSTEKTSESEHPHSNDDSEATTTVSRSRHLALTSDNDDYLGTSKEKWMTALGAKLGSDTANVSLRDFVLPGSHNSAAVNMKDRNCGGGGPLTPADRDRKAKCQEKGILDQLNEGIRYFDLRAVNDEDFDGTGKEYPLLHGFLVDDPVDTMEKALDTIAVFLQKNTEEFVVARIKTYDCNGNKGQIDWKTKFHDIRRMTKYNGIIQTYDDTQLGWNMNNLKGNLFVDIFNRHKELYEEGLGVGHDRDGEDFYRNWDGNPFEIAENINNELQNNNSNTIFNVLSFFPAPASWWEVAFSWGLKTLDENFTRNTWLMHTLVAHKGENVNVILRDYATENKNIYHTATQLTLYRIFDKTTVANGGTAVGTLEDVNYYDEKFEHRCPVGWILGGMSSSHRNKEEDRLWKFKCIKKDWLTSKSEYYLNGDYGNSAKVRNDINEDILTRNGDDNVETKYDDEWSIGDETCKRAITGFGAVVIANYGHKQDRQFYHYSSEVVGNHKSKCSWTKWKNNFDRDLDWQLTRENKYIGEIQSKHKNRKEDRRFKFCICTKTP